MMNETQFSSGKLHELKCTMGLVHDKFTKNVVPFINKKKNDLVVRHRFHAPRTLLAFNSNEHALFMSYLPNDLEIPQILTLGKRDRFNRPITITFGECISLAGDHFETPEALYQTADDYLKDTRWVIGHLDCFLESITCKAGRDYYKLAVKNFTHFRGDHPNNAISEFRRHFDSAISIAGQGHELLRKHKQPAAADKRYHEALVYCAFACHFLTDCLSTGHMRTPRALLTEVCRDFYKGKHVWVPGFGTQLLGDIIAGAYSLVCHNRDNGGLIVESQWNLESLLTDLPCKYEPIDLVDPTREFNNVYQAFGDDFLELVPTNPTWVLGACAIRAATQAIWQMYWFGVCDYLNKFALDDFDDPLSFIPEVKATDNPPPLVYEYGGRLAGELWEKTARWRIGVHGDLIGLGVQLKTEASRYELKEAWRHNARKQED